MQYRSFSAAVCLLLLAVLCLGQTPPPAPDKSDTSKEAVVYERIANSIRFENDGTGVRDTIAVIRVQSQGAVKELGQLVFGYSSATEDLKIDYVRVRKPDGRVVETSAATAQDFAPEILREAPMYSDYRQRHVSVSSLQPGDVLEYHTVTHIQSLAPGQFWYEHSFPTTVPVLDDQLKIDVPKSRELKLKSPKYKYDLKVDGDRSIYTWTIKNFVPKKDDDDEEDDDSDAPHVQLSTFTDWQQVGRWYAKLQGERVVVDDRIRKQAAELTQGATTPEEKARRLYDYVALNIRYVSLSFGVGRLQPHAATEVLVNGYGDCKDKHTLLETLLRAEGIQSYPVLIDSDRKIDEDIPYPGQFDHVITALRLPDGSFTWLDATAEIAPYGLIMYQLRNKQALLASDDANVGLHRTPATSPVKNQATMKIDGKFTEIGALDVTIDMSAQGDSALSLRETFRSVPPANYERVLQYLSGSWGLGGDVSDIHLDPVEQTSKPFHLTYHLRHDDFFRVPNSGVSFNILPAAVGTGMLRPQKKKGKEPLDVGPAEERIFKARIEVPVNFTVHIPTGVTISRDFGDYSSSYVLTRNVLTAERKMALKVNELPATRRADYESFRTVSSSAAEQGLWCSITPASAAAVAAAGKASGTPQELRKAGAAALDRRDFTSAVDLLKRSLDQDTSQKNAWDDLGRAYAGLNQHDDAVRAFRKQIELDPEHPSANRDLAAELQQQGKTDEAITAYRKQAEISPSDKAVHTDLGLLLAQLKRDAEAQTELETAASLPPEDPQVKMALAEVYARTGNKDKSEALMKSVTGGTAVGADLYAAALRDDIDPSQSLHDARKTLDDLGDQFDSGEYDRLGPSAFSAMSLVALAWARLGWARFLQGDVLESMQFLNSAWMLSQSGTVGNRLARVLQKEGQTDKARHMFALAAAAGGDSVANSREQVGKLAASPDAAQKEISAAAVELLQMRTLKLSGSGGSGSAQFGLIFDNDNKPERAEYLAGDTALRAAADQLRTTVFPVKFPDVSSIKIIRRGTVSCTSSGCSLVLMPVGQAEQAVQAAGTVH